MTDAALVAAAARLGPPIAEVGRRFMMDPLTFERGGELGMVGIACYVHGRFGVLGDVDVAVVHAAQGFLGPSMVDDAWADRTGLDGEAASHAYAALARAWGRDRLGGIDGLEAFVASARKLIANADVAGLALFAGWKAVPVPDEDLEGQALQLVHVLREFRGGAHLVACRAKGLGGHAASVLANGGEGAGALGWSAPHPSVEGLGPLHDAAELVTNEIVAGALSALVPDELDAMIATAENLLATTG